MQQNELPEGKSIRRNCSMDELQQEQFTKALLGLVDLAKTKKNVLQYGEINDAFKGLELTEDKMDLVLEYLEKQKIDIAVFGCYMDLGNPDEEVRSYAVDTLKKSMTWAKELGAHVVGTETAYPRLNWELRQQWKPFMMESILRVVEEAVRVDMPLAIEPVWWHPLENLETTMEVLEKVGDAAHLRIIFDASNLLKHPEKTDQDAYWTQ